MASHQSTMKLFLDLPLRILTHNIRYATSTPDKGELPWANRSQPLINELRFNTRPQDSFICLQEVLHNQLVDISTGLNRHHTPAWDYIGVGRDDGHQQGEYSPIFYNPSTWDLRHWEPVWLSETPTKPSKGWDAASIRILTIGVFTHRATDRTVLAMNTHLDDQGSRARSEGARLILKKIEEYSRGEYGGVLSGVFLAGDFNSEETQDAYQVLLSAESPLQDTMKMVERGNHYGNEITATGFEGVGWEDSPPNRIDYVLVGSVDGKVQRQPWEVQEYAVLANRFDDGVFISDHRAVVADVVLRGQGGEAQGEGKEHEAL